MLITDVGIAIKINRIIYPISKGDFFADNGIWRFYLPQHRLYVGITNPLKKEISAKEWALLKPFLSPISTACFYEDNPRMLKNIAKIDTIGVLHYEYKG